MGSLVPFIIMTEEVPCPASLHLKFSGVGTLADCALRIIATVVSRPTADRAIIDAGSKSFSSDPMGLAGHGAILEHPDVQEAAVVGVPHDVLGEDVGAFVVPKSGATIDVASLQQFCGERLADYKRPRHIWFVANLPRNATGKVMKHKLRDMAAR